MCFRAHTECIATTHPCSPKRKLPFHTVTECIKIACRTCGEQSCPPSQIETGCSREGVSKCQRPSPLLAHRSTAEPHPAVSRTSLPRSPSSLSTRFGPLQHVQALLSLPCRVRRGRGPCCHLNDVPSLQSSRSQIVCTILPALFTGAPLRHHSHHASRISPSRRCAASTMLIALTKQ